MIIAAIVEPADVSEVRKNVRALLLPGQREIHFKKEKPIRRRSLVDTVARWPVEIRIYRRSHKRELEKARQLCLDRMVRDLLARKAGRMVLDSRAEQDPQDVRTIRQAVRAHHEQSYLTWEHCESGAELLLALPDVAGWCYAPGANGESASSLSSVT